MAHVFQSNVFQSNVFQMTVAAAAATTAGTGHWRGPARKGRKGGIEGRIRRLSELDDKPLFTPEEILDAGPISVEGIADKALDAVAQMQRKVAFDLAERKRQFLLAQINDDEENFLVM